MKTKKTFLVAFSLFFALLFCGFELSAQEKNQKSTAVKDSNEVYSFVDEMPQFPGELEDFQAFIKNNAKYPAELNGKGGQGTVVVLFIVEKDGSITDAKVVKSVRPELDEDALRIVEKMPKWKPAIRMKKPVRASYTLPITFY